MAELVAARSWLTVCRLPPYASELNPVEAVWSNLKDRWRTSPKQNIGQLTALALDAIRYALAGRPWLPPLPAAA